MTEPIRVTPAEVYPKVKVGKVVFVCAYDDDAKYQVMKLEGSISLRELNARLAQYSKDQEIIFYCA
jgi:predicted dinucleotide-binding enzyme